MPMDCVSVDPLLIPVCKKILWQQNIFGIGVMSASDIIHVFTMGCSRKNPPPPPLTDGILGILAGGGGGGQRPLKSRQEGD